jgi:hypothetical protein
MNGSGSERSVSERLSGKAGVFLGLCLPVMSSSTKDTNSLKRTSIKMAGIGADFPCTLYLTSTIRRLVTHRVNF